jgi:hypothetical protein
MTITRLYMVVRDGRLVGAVHAPTSDAAKQKFANPETLTARVSFQIQGRVTADDLFKAIA